MFSFVPPQMPFFQQMPQFEIKINMRQNVERKKAFKALGVAENANEIEIKKAYKKMAIRWHPDKNQDNKEQAKKKFQEISNAYKILTEKKNGFMDDILRDFMASPGTESDGDAEDILHFMDHHQAPNVFFFGPKRTTSVKKRTLEYRVRVRLKDIWENKSKLLPIEGGRKLKLNLYHQSVLYESKNPSLPWKEVAVTLVDKFHPTFRRVGQYDLETNITIFLSELYCDRVLELKMLDGSIRKVFWKVKRDLPNILEGAEKGFYLYDLGLPFPGKEGKRGKLYVLLDIQLPKTLKLKQEKEEKEEKIEDSKDLLAPEWMEKELWWQRSFEKGKETQSEIILDLDAHLEPKSS